MQTDGSRSLAPATLGALGVVYGDIGTSPLYALKEATAAAGGSADPANVLGVLSLIFWSLFLVITLKYVVLILRWDNAGEGGILSLVALIQQKTGQASPWTKRVIAVGVLGTTLFFCDALITPAISVLSAVEGLELLGEGSLGLLRLRRELLPDGAFLGFLAGALLGTQALPGRLLGREAGLLRRGARLVEIAPQPVQLGLEQRRRGRRVGGRGEGAR